MIGKQKKVKSLKSAEELGVVVQSVFPALNATLC